MNGVGKHNNIVTEYRQIGRDGDGDSGIVGIGREWKQNGGIGYTWVQIFTASTGYKGVTIGLEYNIKCGHVDAVPAGA